MKTITTEEVSVWMKEQLAKAHKLSNYAQITVSISQEKDYAILAKARYSIYLGEKYGHSVEYRSIEECFAKIANPQTRAEKIRADAAKLLKQADELAAFTQY